MSFDITQMTAVPKDEAKALLQGKRQTEVNRVSSALAAAVKSTVLDADADVLFVNMTQLEAMDPALGDYQTKRRERITSGDASATLMTLGAIKAQINAESEKSGIHALTKVVDGIECMSFMPLDEYRQTEGYKAGQKRAEKMRATKAAKAKAKAA